MVSGKREGTLNDASQIHLILCKKRDHGFTLGFLWILSDEAGQKQILLLDMGKLKSSVLG